MKFLQLAFISVLTVLMASGPALAANDGGDNFRRAAKGLMNKATMYEEKGHPELASIFRKMAAIKKEAAGKADKNAYNSIDWTEYQELNAQARVLMQEANKPPERKPANTPG